MTKQTKEYMAENFPRVVEFARLVREVFGDGVRLVGAEENGKFVGKKIEPVVGNVIVFPDYAKKTVKKDKK